MTLKVRETKLRRMAHRQELWLIKSRTRNPNAMDYGMYGLVDVRRNGVVNPPLAQRWVCSWDLDAVEDYLTPDNGLTSAVQVVIAPPQAC